MVQDSFELVFRGLALELRRGLVFANKFVGHFLLVIYRHDDIPNLAEAVFEVSVVDEEGLLVVLELAELLVAGRQGAEEGQLEFLEGRFQVAAVLLVGLVEVVAELNFKVAQSLLHRVAGRLWEEEGQLVAKSVDELGRVAGLAQFEVFDKALVARLDFDEQVVVAGAGRVRQGPDQVEDLGRLGLGDNFCVVALDLVEKIEHQEVDGFKVEMRVVGVIFVDAFVVERHDVVGRRHGTKKNVRYYEATCAVFKSYCVKIITQVGKEGERYRVRFWRPTRSAYRVVMGCIGCLEPSAICGLTDDHVFGPRLGLLIECRWCADLRTILRRRWLIGLGGESFGLI